MWRTADVVKVAARTSAMLWIWSLGSRATGAAPITRSAGRADLPPVVLVDLPASSPSLYPATPLLLSPVGAPSLTVPPIVGGRKPGPNDELGRPSDGSCRRFP
ncbi:hypothetical protein GCM10009559_32970 [Pseudonocardia zijingensis]|uniref:Secreted protein n=1 Tax=Pseudonocardia zijingensis TaxID=153376 RepID=A0ABN1Q805_9PSEU